MVNHMRNSIFCIQKSYSNSSEARAIISAKALSDNIELYFVNDDMLDIVDREHIPVGSVEFCEKVAAANSIELEPIRDYPFELAFILGRKVRKTVAKDVKYGEWCKPFKAKDFPSQLAESFVVDWHGAAVDPETPCWVSSVVTFTSEWRCYVHKGVIKGIAQYDSGPEDHLTDFEIVKLQSLIAEWKRAPIAYAMDVGRITTSNDVTLVEVNDAWGTGYYSTGTLSEKDYAEWLAARWCELAYCA